MALAVRVARSPRGDRYAVVELRDCGATTGYVTVVHVGHEAQPPTDAREVFTADDDHGAAPLGPGGTVWTKVVWTGAERLRITYASRARVFRHSPTADGVTITLHGLLPGELPVE